ncbi:MAG: phage tail length tape measure family protein [Thermoanaerobaculia bacterium]
MIGNLVTTLAVNSAPFKGGLREARGELSNFKSGIASLGGRGVAAALGPAGAAIAGAFAVGTMVNEAREAAAAQNKLAAVLHATGGAAGLSAGQISDYAEELQALTNFEDDATVAAAGTLAMFKNLSGEGFKETLGLAQDLSAVKGFGLEQSVTQLGKALNDPVKGLTLLRKVGIQFTEDQQKQIKALQETGDLMGAQRIMLDGLQGAFGGAAGKMADPITQAQTAIGNLAETVGSLAMPPINGMAKGVAWLANGLNGLISGPAAEAPEAFLGTANAAATLTDEFEDLGEAAAQTDQEFQKSMETATQLRDQYLSSTQQLAASLQQIREASELAGSPVTTDAAARMRKAAIESATGIHGEIQKAKDSIAVMNGTLSETDILLREISQKGAGEHAKEELEILRTLLEQKQALEEQQKLQEEATEERKRLADFGRQVTEETRTPFEQFQKRVNELARARDAGVISEDTFLRAAKKAKEELEGTELKVDVKPSRFEEVFSPSNEGVSRNSRESLAAIVARQRGFDESNARRTAENTAKLVQQQSEANRYLQAVSGQNGNQVVFKL